MRKKLPVIVAFLLVLAICASVAWAAPSSDKKEGLDPVKMKDLKSQVSTPGEDGNSLPDQPKGKAPELKKGKHFSDTDSHWAKSTIDKMADKELFKGYDDGTFRPEDPLTQAEAVVLADRIASLKKTGKVEDTSQEDTDTEDSDLADVPDWAKESVSKAVYSNAVNLARFHSAQQAERVLACVVIAKNLGLDPVSPEDGTEFRFADQDLISAEDLGYILALREAGYILGDPDGKFNPNSFIKRGEMATIMSRITDDLPDSTSTDQ